MGTMSVEQAAGKLGVSERFVRRLLQRGDLAGELLSGRWLVDAAAVRSAVEQRAPVGRPLAPSTAWSLLALLSEAAPEEAAQAADGEITAPVSRAWSRVPDRGVRYRLRAFLSSHEVDASFVAALRRRADRRRFWVHPGVLDAVLADPVVSVGGARAAGAHGMDISPGNEARGYVREADLAAVIKRYQLEADPAGALELLVVPDHIPKDDAPVPGQPVAEAVALVDLLGDVDARSEHLAKEWLSLCRDQLVTVTALRTAEISSDPAAAATSKARRRPRRGAAS